MLKAVTAGMAGLLLAAGVAAAQDKVECTDAHMKEMDAMVAKMSDTTKQQEAQKHLSMARDAAKAKDQAGCLKHMEEVHKSMGH